MKKSILTAVGFAMVCSAFITSCSSSAKKVEEAKENVAEAKEDVIEAKEEVMEANENLNDAQQDYMADMEKFRVKTSENIAANDAYIADFKVKITNEKKEAKAAYNKRIVELENKNREMKKKMDDYKDDGKEKWESFKTEFSSDMDELGKAFKDLTVNNVK